MDLHDSPDTRAVSGRRTMVDPTCASSELRRDDAEHKSADTSEGRDGKGRRRTIIRIKVSKRAVEAELRRRQERETKLSKKRAQDRAYRARKKQRMLDCVHLTRLATDCTSSSTEHKSRAGEDGSRRMDVSEHFIEPRCANPKIVMEKITNNIDDDTVDRPEDESVHDGKAVVGNDDDDDDADAWIGYPYRLPCNTVSSTVVGADEQTNKKAKGKAKCNHKLAKIKRALMLAPAKHR